MINGAQCALLQRASDPPRTALTGWSSYLVCYAQYSTELIHMRAKRLFNYALNIAEGQVKVWETSAAAACNMVTQLYMVLRHFQFCYSIIVLY